LGLKTAVISESDIAQEALLDVHNCPENVRNGSDGEKQGLRTIMADGGDGCGYIGGGHRRPPDADADHRCV
jgi:hypothetical protein